MLSSSRTFGSSRIWWIIAGVGATLLCCYLAASGRRSYELLAVVIAAAPVLVWLALARPYLMPYGIYAALIPFDNLLSVGHFGTLTKLLGLVSGVMLILYGLRRRRFNPLPMSVVTWSLYAVWAGTTAIWALNPTSTMTSAATLAELVLLYAAISTAPLSKGDLRVVVGAAVLGALVAGAYGAWLFHHQNNMAIVQEQAQLARLSIQIGDRTIDANHYADSLLFPLIALIVWTFATRSWWKKCAMIAGVGVIVAGIYYSASRESLLAILVALVYLFYAAPHYRRQLLVVFGVLALMSAAVPNILVRFGNAVTTGGSGRTSIWHTGVAAVQSYWLTGAGFYNFADAYDSKYLQVFQQYQAGWHRVAHDIVLQTIVELGIVGLMFLAIALYYQFTLVNDIGPGDDLYDYRLMTQAGMIALMIAALFIDLVIYKYLWFLFATMTQVYAVAQRHETVPLRATARLTTVRG